MCAAHACRQAKSADGAADKELSEAPSEQGSIQDACMLPPLPVRRPRTQPQMLGLFSLCAARDRAGALLRSRGQCLSGSVTGWGLCVSGCCCSACPTTGRSAQVRAAVNQASLHECRIVYIHCSLDVWTRRVAASAGIPPRPQRVCANQPPRPHSRVPSPRMACPPAAWRCTPACPCSPRVRPHCAAVQTRRDLLTWHVCALHSTAFNTCSPQDLRMHIRTHGICVAAALCALKYDTPRSAEMSLEHVCITERSLPAVMLAQWGGRQRRLQLAPVPRAQRRAGHERRGPHRLARGCDLPPAGMPQ